MATIKEIAGEAGVSIATVSRALNNHPSVNEATRLAVLQVAERLNYPLSDIPSRQRIKRSVIILVRQDQADGPLEKRDLEVNVWNGVQNALEHTGISTRLQQSQMTLAEAQHYVSDVSVSGLIILGGIVQPEFARYLRQERMPFVVAGASLREIQADAVMADVAHGMHLIVARLISRNCRHIGFVNGPSETLTSVEKLDALRFILFSQGLPFPRQNLVSSQFTAEDGYQRTGELLAQAERMDAIIFADDVIALGGIRALREQNIAIPGEIKVASFGDYEIAKFIDPALTTVHFDMQKMGRIAAKRICMLLEEPDDDGWLIRMPTHLVVRDSA